MATSSRSKAESTASAVAQLEWLPIGTAPHDGTPILCCWEYGTKSPGRAFLRYWFNTNLHMWMWDDLHENDCIDNAFDPPTHWFPLPKLPIKGK